MPKIRTQRCRSAKIGQKTIKPKNGPNLMTRQYNQIYGIKEATVQWLPDTGAPHPSIICLASLYKPMEFLCSKIDNFNAVLPQNAAVWFADCSPPEVWLEVQNTINVRSRFRYILSHFSNRTTLYYTWNWIIKHAIQAYDPKYFCNTNVDDIIGPEYFKIMPQTLEINNTIYLVACSWYVTHDKGQTTWPPPSCDGISVVTDIGSFGHFPMWRASLHKLVGLFDPNMLAIGDSDFWSRVKGTLGQAAMRKISEALCCYVSHSNNLYYAAKGPDQQSGESWDIGTMQVRTPQQLESLKHF